MNPWKNIFPCMKVQALPFHRVPDNILKGIVLNIHVRKTYFLAYSVLFTFFPERCFCWILRVFRRAKREDEGTNGWTNKSIKTHFSYSRSGPALLYVNKSGDKWQMLSTFSANMQQRLPTFWSVCSDNKLCFPKLEIARNNSFVVANDRKWPCGVPKVTFS